MQRRSLLVLGALASAGLFRSRTLGALSAKIPSMAEQRETAEQLNTLAANVRTLADARRLEDFLADLFSKEIHGLLSGSLRRRIAEAEFAAVSDPKGLIPEERVVAAWNGYVETMQAPVTSKVTVAEVHYLRDAYLATARTFWGGEYVNFWSVPSIYATRADGGIADGCRAIEAIRVLTDLANHSDNLEGVRDDVRQGVLFSEVLRRERAREASLPSERRLVVGVSQEDPMRAAQRQYMQAHGMRRFHRALVAMVENAVG